MSFSFRNIFSPDDSEFEAAADPTVSNGFSAPGGIPLGRGSLSGEAPASGPVQSFLASELLPYIPKALAAQSGIPMTKEVKVPLPADGSLDVRLSVLYQVCPELFAAEITPLNDSDVTLPPRLGGIPDSPAVAGSVFSKPSLTTATAPEAAANPFWSPVTTGSSAPSGTSVPATSVPGTPSPFQAPDKPATEAKSVWPAPTSTKDNPFSAEPAPSPKAFSAPEADPPAETPKFAGGFDAPATPPAADKFGTAPMASEPAPSVGFFGFSETAPVKDEGGDAGGPARKNPFESNEGFSTLFSKQAQADAAIPYPAKPAFTGGGSSGKASEPEGVWGAMFSGTAFEDEEEEVADAGAAPFESIGNLLKLGMNPPAESAPVANAFGGMGPAPAPAAAVTPDPEVAFVTGFTAFAPASADEPKKEAPVSAPSDPFAGFAALPAEPAVPAPSMNPAPPAFPPFQSTPPAIPVDVPPPADPFAMPQGFGSPAPVLDSAPEPEVEEEPAASAPSFMSFTPAREAFAAPAVAEVPEAAAPAPVVAETPEIQQPAAAVSLPVVEEEEPIVESLPDPAETPSTAPSAPANDDELRDLELRAIFSTGEVFTFSKVARKVVGLPGINSCSLSAPGKLVQASRREENRLGNEARDMVATLRSLAKLTGLPEARTFTLQTDRGIVSLFLEGDCCVTVHHDSSVFQPGVREKLILVARSLAKLRE